MIVQLLADQWKFRKQISLDILPVNSISLHNYKQFFCFLFYGVMIIQIVWSGIFMVSVSCQILRIKWQFIIQTSIVFRQDLEEYDYKEVDVSSKEADKGGSRLVGAREIKHETAPFLVAINAFEWVPLNWVNNNKKMDNVLHPYKNFSFILFLVISLKLQAVLDL